MRVRYMIGALLGLVVMAAGNARAGDEERIDCGNAVTTYEMNACADRAFTAADADLNAVYQRALKAVPEMASDKPYDAKSWEAALRASQRAWVAFRDAECRDHVAMFWTGGTGATVDIVSCMSEKTKARSKELSDRYDDAR